MYNLSYVAIVQKQTSGIPKKDLEKIKLLILGLSDNPRPLKCKKLVGSENDYRIRYRHWRILYAIDDKNKEVTIYGILHRKEAYL